jgi:RimJ/RimL family protein N-acetyltransferase
MPDTPSINPAYRIVTGRTVVRCWNPADAPLLKAAIDASLDHLRPWMPWAADHPQPVEQVAGLLRRFRGEFDLGQDFVYGVFDREERQVLGGTGLHTRRGEDVLEIGYWIHAQHINRGIATEISAALTRVAFEVHRVRRVEIYCVAQNVRSAAVPAKLAYVHEATLAQRVQDQGEWRDMMIWSLFDHAYPASPAARAEIEAYDALGRAVLPAIASQPQLDPTGGGWQ